MYSYHVAKKLAIKNLNLIQNLLQIKLCIRSRLPDHILLKKPKLKTKKNYQTTFLFSFYILLQP